MTSSNWIQFFLITQLALIGCSLPKPESKDRGQQATFFADKSSAKFIETKWNSKVSIPDSKVINLTACLKDLQFSKPVINHAMSIRSESRELKTSTDAQGCLTWSENIVYNHLANAKYVRIEREVIADGFQKGQVVLSFAINPWEDVAHSLLDTDASKFTEMVSTQDSAKALIAESQGGLWVDDLRLNVDERQVGKLLLEIRTVPMIKVQKSTGLRVNEPLTKGEFTTEILLIHQGTENGKEFRRMITQPVKSDGEIINGGLYIEAPMALDKLCTEGQVQLGLKIQAKHTDQMKIKSFEGVFFVGRCSQIIGSFFARVKNETAKLEGEFKLETYLTDNKALELTAPNNPQPGADSYQPARIEIGRLITANKGFTDHRAFHRERLLNISACLRSGLDGRSLRAQTLDVTKLNGKIEKITTNNDGCVSWDDSVEFNFFALECWISKKVVIKNQNLGINQEIEVTVNPWAQSETFARDTRFLDSEGKKALCASGENELVLQRYDFDKLYFSYELDEFLNLKMKKTGELKLGIRVKRPSLTDPGVYAEENAPVGSYLVRGVVVDMNAMDLKNVAGRVYHSFEKVFHVQGNGTIASQIELATANIKAIGNTNQIVFEIKPLREGAKSELEKNPNLDPETLTDTTSVLKNVAYRGPLLMMSNNEGGTLEPIYLNKGESLVKRIMNQKNVDDKNNAARLKRISNKAQFVRGQSLVPLNLNDEKQTESFRKSLMFPTFWRPELAQWKTRDRGIMPTKQLTQFLRSGQMSKDLAKRICAFWFYDLLARPTEKAPKGVIPDSMPHSWQLMNRCQGIVERQGPENFFAIEFHNFVQNPKIAVDQDGRQKVQSYAKDLMINQGFGFNRGYNESITKNVTADTGLSVKIPEIFFISPSLGTRVSIQKSWAQNSGYGAQVSFNSGVSGTLERLKFQIQTSGSEKCALIRLQPELYIGQRAALPHMMSHMMSPEEKLRFAQVGLFICEGVAQPRPQTFEENFFIFNQRPQMTQMIDPAADNARPFFFSLRGIKDARSFLAFLQAQYSIPGEPDGSLQINEALKDRLENVFLQGAPSSPGRIVTER
ncbi:MAG: hypothetical protein LW875_07530 [Proteobacteria bacterium]|jgi:hypothetical protein|nr:hypothetical protein [Pseudomonadota bacterium]